MNRRLLALLLVSLLHVPAVLSGGETDLRPNENLYAYKARMEAYFAPQIAARGLGALVEAEGSEYNEYVKFLLRWEPRLAPHGDFDRYYQLEWSFYNRYGRRRQRLVRHGDVQPDATLPNLSAWQELGPIARPSGGGGGGIGPIEFLAFFESAPVHMLAGSTAGGLFYSSNGGASWSNGGTDTKIYRSGVSSAVFHPSDHRTWFAASSGGNDRNDAQPIGLAGGVFRTTDLGATWTRIASAGQLGGSQTRINELLATPGRLWAATSSGLFVTDEPLSTTTSSWRPALPGVYVYDVELRPGDPKWVYAAVSGTDGWKFVYSGDTGATWHDVPGQPSAAGANQLTLDVTPAAPRKLYVLIGRKDGCWGSRGTTNGTSALHVYDFALAQWQTVTTTACISMGGGNAFAVDRVDPNEIFLSHDTEGRRYIFGATPLFTTFDSHYFGGTYHADIESFTAHPSNPSEVWMTHHGGVSVSSDNGRTWSDRSTGLGVAQALGLAAGAEAPGAVALGLYHDGTVLTQSPWLEPWSPSWKFVAGGDGLRPMISATSQFVWATHQGGTWYRSPNYGQSFTGNPPSSPVWSFRASAFNQPSSMTQFRIAADHTVRRTTDGGTTWPAVITSFPATFQLATLYTSRTDGDALLVQSSAAGVTRLYRTLKANASPPEVIASWQELPLPSDRPISDIELDPADANVLYIAYTASTADPSAVVGNDMIVRADYTSPSAPLFRDLTLNLPNATTGNDALALDVGDEGGLYYACDFGVFYSNAAMRASGDGWVQLGRNLPHTSFNGIEINRVNRKVRVASLGRGAWEHDLAAAVTGVVFDDGDQDGVRDPGERALAGLSVTLTSAAGAVATASTGPNGEYAFYALDAGPYVVTQTPPTGWFPTIPATGSRTVTLTAGMTAAGIDFGNDFAEELTGGKVVFSSNRVQPPQLFVQPVGSPSLQRRVTDEFFGARHPKWSPDGRYIVYISSTIIVGPSDRVDMLVVIDDGPSPQQHLVLYAPRVDARTLGYPQWSSDGKSIVFWFVDSLGNRGLGIIRMPAPYAFGNFEDTLFFDPASGIQPGEPIFSHDGQTVYFAADAPSAGPAALFRISAAGGTPVPVNDQTGTQVRRFFSPSLSPDGTRLMFNSEMWKEQPQVYRDEEILELNVQTGELRRITAEPGNQYGFFAKNGSGEFLLQSNHPTSAPYGLFLQKDGKRVPLDVGDPQNLWTESGDWWKTP